MCNYSSLSLNKIKAIFSLAIFLNSNLSRVIFPGPVFLLT
uniref:Uncharacterized protein n=1 Tax=Lepeophtheirus salmonis TaxID=72036 RepID=A0A0K2U2A6_LEPSM